MGISRFFSKPRWQSKDDAVRRAAVAADPDDELLAALPRIAREDPDAGVRLAALRRLADPGLSQALAIDDRDEGVRHAAQALWTDLLTGTHANAPTIAERVRLLRAQDDPRLIEHVAVRAPEAGLRLAALARVSRPALLAERATADADAGVREAALARIDDEAQLARIVERARKGDKKTSRDAAARLEQLRLARGDADAVREHARALCSSLEAIVRGGDAGDAQRIDAAWNAIIGEIDAALRTRYAAARELYELSRDPLRVAELRKRARDRERVAQELAALEHELAAADAVQQRDALALRFERLAERFAAGAAADAAGPQVADAQRVRAIAQRVQDLLDMPLAATTVAADPAPDPDQAGRESRTAAAAARRERERAEREAQITALDAALAAVEPALEAGNSIAAHAGWPTVVELRRRIGDALPAALRARLADADAQYARLSEWQRWSDNHRRRQLCEEIEALPASGLHPDAVATRLREAQAEWARLDQLEGKPASANDGLGRRFRALCRAAIEPTRPYFEKRDELRRSHSRQLQELIARANAATAETEPLAAITALRREAAQGLRMLDDVDPRERKGLAQKLKDALAALDQRVDASHAAVEAAKSAMIEQATALAGQADLRGAMNAARDLQKRWQAAGNGRRGRDEAQWRAFRKAVDAVFSRADQERSERITRDRESLDAAAAVCAGLEALAAAAEAAPRAEVARLDAEWSALGIADPALRQRHQNAHAALRDAHGRRQRAERRARFDTWLAHHRELVRAERGECDAPAMQAARAALPPLSIAEPLMREREAALASGPRADDRDDEARRDCVIEIEQLAGIESPAEDLQRRRELQLGKLSARMRGDLAGAPLEQLEALLVRYSGLRGAADAAQAQDRRFEQAVMRMLDDLA